jgi:thioredoxin-dependent peroxiredoxin
MVSLDDPERNRAFAESVGADLVLLSDPSGETARAYGVTSLGGLFARRWTFYIDHEGVIRKIDKDVQVTSAGQDIARTLEALGFPRAPKTDGEPTPSQAPEAEAPPPDAPSDVTP